MRKSGERVEATPPSGQPAAAAPPRPPVPAHRIAPPNRYRKIKPQNYLMRLKRFPLIGSDALFYLVLLKQTFVFQKYTVYTFCSYRYKHLQRDGQAGVDLREKLYGFPSGPAAQSTTVLLSVCQTDRGY